MKPFAFRSILSLSILMAAGVAIPAWAQTLTVLYSFTGGGDGDIPFGGVIRDSAGNLYGTTVDGGAFGKGVVFKVDTTNSESVLYSFAGGSADGANPNGDLVRDQSGNIFGTTELGGASNDGIIYKLSPSNHETVLHVFTGGTDGGQPRAGLTVDSAGHLYGTGYYGGSGCALCGVVFKVLPTSGGETVFYNFTGGSDGANPFGGVIADSAGNLYGTNTADGASGQGVVYKIDASGHLSVLYNFTSGAGAVSVSKLTLDSAGNLYGTAINNAGSSGEGVVFKIDTAGTYSVLHSFAGGSHDGETPFGALLLGNNGNLYGTTSFGGGSNMGTVYRVNSTTGAFTLLHSFSGPDGADPQGRLIRDSAGNLYGTTEGGGAFSQGTVFKITP
jgi:uncharacterized repeat protein (TIGR03803 family)